MTPTKLAFERMYSDGSGVEFGVYYDELATWRKVTVKAVHNADFDVEDLDWLIESLTAIRAALSPKGQV